MSFTVISINFSPLFLNCYAVSFKLQFSARSVSNWPWEFNMQESWREPIFWTDSFGHWTIGQFTKIVNVLALILESTYWNLLPASIRIILISGLLTSHIFSVLSSNAFTGDLPVEFAKLTSLTDLWVQHLFIRVSFQYEPHN